MLMENLLIPGPHRSHFFSHLFLFVCLFGVCFVLFSTLVPVSLDTRCKKGKETSPLLGVKALLSLYVALCSTSEIAL